MRRLTKNEFINISKLRHIDRYDYSLVEYESSKTKVKIICPIHGEFEQRPNSHLSGRGCIECSGLKRPIMSEFIEKCVNIHGDKYDYSNIVYINSKTDISILCKKHGYFYQSPNSHLNGRGCPECSSIKSTTSLFIEKSNIIHNFKYDYSLVEYLTARNKVNIICDIHGLFTQTPSNHLKGTGCPVCRYSKGELKVMRVLEKHKLKFKTQFEFKDCKFKRQLYFDFYLPDYNICIEYNGQQHYECVEGFGGIENFKLRVTRDLIKKKYCEENNISLLSISYKDEDIDSIILDYVNSFRILT